MQDEIKAYNQGNYQQVIKIGQVLATKNPANSMVHYYLANAYSGLGCWQAAQQEYFLCQRFAEDRQMRIYCAQAIAFLQSQTNKVHSQPLAYPATATARIGSSRLISTGQDTIRKETQDQINGAEQTVNRRIETINKRAQDMIDAVPRYVYEGNRVVANPDYQATVEQIRRDAERNVAIAKEDLKHSRQSITQAQTEKLNALDSSVSSVPSQFTPGITGLELSPGNAFPYIKNYLNLVPAAPPPFPIGTSKPK